MLDQGAKDYDAIRHRLARSDGPYFLHQKPDIYESDWQHLDDAFYTTDDHSYDHEAIIMEVEFEVNELELPTWNVETLLEQCYATTANKRAASEVSYRRLTPEEQQEFREAKHKEWGSWVSNKVAELMVHHGVPRDRVISSRWVLSWKTVPQDTLPPNDPRHRRARDGQVRVAKARLVLRGFEDPDLGKYMSASPTVTRTARSLLFCISANFVWRVFCLDAKTAFLTINIGKRARPLYFTVPPDLAAELKISRNAVLKLVKAAYGLSEAPIAWYKYLVGVLVELGWKLLDCDQSFACLHGTSGALIGLCAIHVDDLLIAGDSKHNYSSNQADTEFDDNMKELELKINFGARRYNKFKYTGCEIE